MVKLVNCRRSLLIGGVLALICVSSLSHLRSLEASFHEPPRLSVVGDIAMKPELQQAPIESPIGGVLIEGGTAYFGTQGGTFHALDLSTGQENWRYETTAPVLLWPILSGGVLYFGGEDGFLHALDAETGEVLWLFEAGRVDYPIRDKFVNGVPTLIDDVIYFTSEDFNLYAVNIENGEEVWRFNLGEEVQQLEIPIVDGVAYVGSWNGYMFAIDVEMGQEIWRSQTDNFHLGEIGIDEESFTPTEDVPEGERQSNQVPFVTAVPVTTDDSVYFSDWTGNLFSVDIETGQQQWRYKPETVNLRHTGSRFFISLFDDVVYYTTQEDKKVYGVDASTGEEVWRLDEFESGGWLDGPIQTESSITFLMEFLVSESGEPRGVQYHALDLETRDIM